MSFRPCFSFLCVLCVFAVNTSYSENSSLDDPTLVDDGDKTSARVNDLINSVETASKAMDAYNTAKSVKKTYDQVKQFKNLKDVKNFGVSKLKEAVTQYKSCKWSFFTWVSHISNKMSDVMSRCNDKVNQWRTTEPMLLNYYKSMQKLSNNTLQVFRDFEFSDMIDIDRKWSRRMERQLENDKDLVYSFCAFASSRFQSDYHKQKYSRLFMPYAIESELSNTDERLIAYLEMKDNVHEFRQIPFQTLTFASDALLNIRELADQAHGVSTEDPSVSKQEHAMELIEASLRTENATYNDICDNGVLIADKRAEVSLQRTQLHQIYSELQTRYSRLLLRRQERMALEYEGIDETLNKLVNGGEFETIDEARLRRFGEGAGVIN
ncbi:MAG: hypothetical protein GX556_17390 [Fibrobacter sp.]|nr:hypothetical protein [Fibrobacter sp.]